MSTNVRSTFSSASDSRLRTVAWPLQVQPAPAAATLIADSRVGPAGVDRP
jgi:hypothetical protein